MGVNDGVTGKFDREGGWRALCLAVSASKPSALMSSLPQTTRSPRSPTPPAPRLVARTRRGIPLSLD